MSPPGNPFRPARGARPIRRPLNRHRDKLDAEQAQLEEERRQARENPPPVPEDPESLPAWRPEPPPPPRNGYPRRDRPGKNRRHPKYDRLRGRILEGLYSGQPLGRVLRRLGLGRWEHSKVVKDDREWALAVAEAREEGKDALADRLLDPDEYPKDRGIANSWTQSSRWYLERRSREKYGPRVDVNVTRTVVLRDGLEAAREREARMLERRQAEAIETTVVLVDEVDDPAESDGVSEGQVVLDADYKPIPAEDLDD